MCYKLNRIILLRRHVLPFWSFKLQTSARVNKCSAVQSRFRCRQFHPSPIRNSERKMSAERKAFSRGKIEAVQRSQFVHFQFSSKGGLGWKQNREEELHIALLWAQKVVYLQQRHPVEYNLDNLWPGRVVELFGEAHKLKETRQSSPWKFSVKSLICTPTHIHFGWISSISCRPLWKFIVILRRGFTGAFVYGRKASRIA